MGPLLHAVESRVVYPRVQRVKPDTSRRRTRSAVAVWWISRLVAVADVGDPLAYGIGDAGAAASSVRKRSLQVALLGLAVLSLRLRGLGVVHVAPAFVLA
jgi:hypothetical protein